MRVWHRIWRAPEEWLLAQLFLELPTIGLSTSDVSHLRGRLTLPWSEATRGPRTGFGLRADANIAMQWAKCRPGGLCDLIERGQPRCAWASQSCRMDVAVLRLAPWLRQWDLVAALTALVAPVRLCYG